MKKIKDRKNLIIACIILIFFLILAFLIFNENIIYIDKYIENYILNIRNEKLTQIMTLITNFSSAYILIIIIILILLISKNKQKTLLISNNLICIFLINQIVKLFFRRNRPPVKLHLIDAAGFSFPSGHAMVSMAFYGFIAYLIYINIKNKYLKILLIIFTFCFVSLIGFSRIYLGVHYFSDVLGGFLLAISYLIIFIQYNKNKILGDKI